MVTAMFVNVAALIVVVGGWAAAVAHVYRALGRGERSGGPPPYWRERGWQPAGPGRGEPAGPCEGEMAGRAAGQPLAGTAAASGVERDREPSVAA